VEAAHSWLSPFLGFAQVMEGIAHIALLVVIGVIAITS
jgi:hypothetical protein